MAAGLTKTALVRLLAKTLDCPRNQVELIRGHTSRHKTVKVYGLKAETVLQRLGISGSPSAGPQSSRNTPGRANAKP